MSEDAVDQVEQGFKSPEEAEEMRASVRAMISAAAEHYGIKPLNRKIYAVENFHDPQAVDPENGNIGAIVERKKWIPQPEGVQTTEWRDYTEDGKSAYRWSVSFAGEASNPTSTMVTLESGAPYNPMADFNLNLGAGIIPIGRRIEDYVFNEDGSVDVRTADYTVVGGEYRIASPTYRTKATEEQVAFLRASLGGAELLNTSGKRTGVTADEVAPDLAS